MRRTLPFLLFSLVLPAAPAYADGGAAVSINNAAFATPHVDVLAGETVSWRNASFRAHSVNAVDGSWSSSRLIMAATFGHRFDTPGTYAYYCQLHPTMRGDVGVHRVLLDAPKDAAASGRPYAVSGRAALPAGSTVTIRAGGEVAGTAKVDDHGTFTATVTPTATTSYTADAEGDSAPPVQVLVLDRKVSAAARIRNGNVVVDAQVTPASKGATVVLQLRLKEHFGWWPVQTVKVGADSRAEFSLARGRKVAARVLLTASDGATELARSATFRLR